MKIQENTKKVNQTLKKEESESSKSEKSEKSEPRQAFDDGSYKGSDGSLSQSDLVVSHNEEMTFLPEN